MTHSISIKPPLQAFGSVPTGSGLCNCEDNLKKKIMLESRMIVHIAQNGWHCFDFKNGGHWVPLLLPSSAKGEGN